MTTVCFLKADLFNPLILAISNIYHVIYIVLKLLFAMVAGVHSFFSDVTNLVS